LFKFRFGSEDDNDDDDDSLPRVTFRCFRTMKTQTRTQTYWLEQKQRFHTASSRSNTTWRSTTGWCGRQRTEVAAELQSQLEAA